MRHKGDMSDTRALTHIFNLIEDMLEWGNYALDSVGNSMPKDFLDRARKLKDLCSEELKRDAYYNSYANYSDLEKAKKEIAYKESALVELEKRIQLMMIDENLR